MNIHNKPPTWVELESVIPLEQPKRKIKGDKLSVEEITNLSHDTSSAAIHNSSSS